uniref:Basonuclin zinc finger protein 1 n=1 Tax=Callorhinchus milii TaxID=7868 RepID=A0A4W3GV34_CALMI|eukprot:gi/632938508/ref/XP_007905232.1/ PREDICTED: zinc finger protein basonuclin-1 isoform X1 [Callorhinchus milii]
MSEAIRCTLVNCNCECFQPGKINLRQCDQCKHGWVVHALDKLRVHHLYQHSQVEIVQSNVVFDISSLMLYGTQAVPIRLKILLDRLFSVLKQEEVLQILHSLGWTLQDYIRGYILQDVSGKVLDRWTIMTYEEEMVSLHQFLRFGETKSIVELMAIQEKEGHSIVISSTKSNSDIRAFIESSNQTRNPGLSTHVEKVNSNNIHHFENIVNNLAFMLPFQFFNPIPMPLLGTSPNGFLVDQSEDRSQETKPDIQIPTSKSHLLSTSPASFQSAEDSSKSSQDGTNQELKNDSRSECSPVASPSAGVILNREPEVTHLPSPTKIKPVEKPHSATKKGRVYCSACDKTFYDKGTLKIHYNAVHLKIKHRCTIEGCNMVFSSLRSRNRHSSNPNPRLHMPMMKNNRDKDLRSDSSPTVIQLNDKRLDINNYLGTDTRPVTGFDNNCAESNLQHHVQSNVCHAGHSGMLFQNLKTVQPVLPFYRSLVTPAELAITPSPLPSLPLVHASVREQLSAGEPSTDVVPKKKSRKSSMPVKIEKETVEEIDGAENGISDDDTPLQLRSEIEFKSLKHDFEIRIAEKIESSREYSPDREKQSLKVQPQDLITANVQANSGNGKLENGLQCIGNGNPCAKTVIVSSIEDGQRETELDNGGKVVTKSEGWLQEEHSTNKDDNPNYNEMQQRLINGGLGSLLLNQRVSLPSLDGPPVSACICPQAATNMWDNQGTSNPNYCYVCKKVFKSSYSVKLHYKNVHLKEMHMCTIEGCNAAFPSRRSRDRHSANINLHHKLLTKDSYENQNNFSNTAPATKEFYEDILFRGHLGQTSLLLKGRSRSDHFVFSLNETQEQYNSAHGGNGIDDGTVLDLSTTSSIKSGSSAHSWDSDAGSEEGIPVEDDEGFESSDLIVQDKLHHISGLIDEPIDCLIRSSSAGSPIMCNICQKMYSNKGTFRAHYKTVHLRQLHKCKVSGCNIMFSSVRSRNRHSQNPNLHKDLLVCSSNESH